MKCFYRLFGGANREERGNVVVLVAILIIVLFGFTALVIDVGQLYMVRRQMVSAADGAALAASMEKYNQNLQHENRARNVAKEYAEKNGAVNFDKDLDVAFTPTYGEDRTIHVRACRPVEFTFARVIGFEDTLVCAVASVEEGPGNPLVPFVKIGYRCDCGACSCEDCDGGICECLCDCAEGECECIFECEYESYGFVIKNDDGGWAKPGDTVQLKYENWPDSGFSPGGFAYVRLPGRQGVDLRHDIGGGYTGPLLGLKACETEIREEGGHTLGNLVKGLESRLSFADDPPCTTFADVINDPYTCPLVVIIPLVHTKHEVDDNYDLGNKYAKVVGYASLLLTLSGEEHLGDDDKIVHGILIEYLDWDSLLDILPEQLEGFVLKLVKTEGNPFTEVASD